MKTLEIILMSIITIMILTLGVIFVKSALNRSEVVECNKWVSQAAEYNGFYITHWQNDQCNAHGIQINAPIK